MPAIPFRLDYARCSNKCPPRDTSITNPQGGPLTGNINMPGSMNTQPLRYATAIRSAFVVAHRGSNNVKPPTTSFISNPVNAFGRRYGAPGGSGRAPRNRF